MRSYFHKHILFFLSITGSIHTHPVSERSVQLRSQQVRQIIRVAGHNPLIHQQTITPYRNPINYQQKREVVFAATLAGGFWAAMESIGIFSATTGVAFGIIASQQNMKNKLEQRQLATALACHVQDTITSTGHSGIITAEDQKAIELAAVEIVKNNADMRHHELKEALIKETKKILQKSFLKRNPDLIGKPNISGPLVNVPVEQPKPSTGCGSTEVVEDFPLIHLPAEKPQIHIGCGSTDIPHNPPLIHTPTKAPEAEDFVLQREEKKKSKAEIEKEKSKQRPDREPSKENNKKDPIRTDRYDKTPISNPELFTKIKGRPGWLDRDGNEWAEDKSKHGGRHFDVKGSDGKRLKEVAFEDGKVLSDGTKGDPKKFNSTSSDKMTRGERKTSPVNNTTLPAVAGGIAAVQTSLSSSAQSVASGSAQPPHNTSFAGWLNPRVNTPQIPDPTPVQTAGISHYLTRQENTTQGQSITMGNISIGGRSIRSLNFSLFPAMRPATTTTSKPTTSKATPATTTPTPGVPAAATPVNSAAKSNPASVASKPATVLFGINGAPVSFANLSNNPAATLSNNQGNTSTGKRRQR